MPSPADPFYHLVMGCPRSGTTFLMRVLNTVPGAVCVSGIIFPSTMTQIVTAPHLPPDLYDALAIEFERSLVRYLDSGLFHSRAMAMQKWKASRTGLGGLRAALRGERAVNRMVFKEPFLTLAPAFVWQAFPRAPIIYLIRDGRDCANSLTRTYAVLTDEKLTDLRSTEMRVGRKVDHRYVPGWVAEGDEDAFLAASPYGRAVWMWKVMVRRCHDFFARPDVAASGRILLVRYEELMRDPQAQGERIAAHFGLSITSRFREQLATAHTRSIGKYTARPESDQQEALAIAGEELALLGYL